jgi:uncharacterized protein YndB with AHSA1/START domain
VSDATDTIELRFERFLPAPPDEVFDAYTDAQKQKDWFSILDEEPGVAEIEVDLRVGGKQTAVWGRNRDELFHETQVFHVVDRPHRLVATSTGSDPSGSGMTTEVEITFAEDGDGTLVSVVHSGFPDPESRDFFQDLVWPGAFDRLEAYLLRERE